MRLGARAPLTRAPRGAYPSPLPSPSSSFRPSLSPTHTTPSPATSAERTLLFAPKDREVRVTKLVWARRSSTSPVDPDLVTLARGPSLSPQPRRRLTHSSVPPGDSGLRSLRRLAWPLRAGLSATRSVFRESSWRQTTGGARGGHALRREVSVSSQRRTRRDRDAA